LERLLIIPELSNIVKVRLNISNLRLFRYEYLYFLIEAKYRHILSTASSPKAAIINM
jgi:hypothetical protein